MVVEGYAVRNRVGLLLILLIIGVIGLVAVSDDPLVFIAPEGCDWQTVEIDGQTFASEDDLRAAAESEGVDFDDVFGDTDFRESGGELEFRPEVCGEVEVPADQ